MRNPLLFPVIVTLCVCGCDKERNSQVMSQNSNVSRSILERIEKYNGVPHLLDDCYNDGLMWRADVSPSALSGTTVECLIPFDDKNYEEGDLIPNYYKWVYDRYVESEGDLKGLVAANLLEAAKSRGLKIEASGQPTPEEILQQFELSMIFLLDPDEDERGHVMLCYAKGKSPKEEFDVVVSIDPLGVMIAGEYHSPSK
jgi:hypothetical protein